MKSRDQPSGLNKMQNSNGSISHVTHLIYLGFWSESDQFLIGNWSDSDQTPPRNWSDLVLTGSDQIWSELTISDQTCSEKSVLLSAIWLEEWSQKFWADLIRSDRNWWLTVKTSKDWITSFCWSHSESPPPQNHANISQEEHCEQAGHIYTASFDPNSNPDLSPLLI